jgi:hypothetical protein
VPGACAMRWQGPGAADAAWLCFWHAVCSDDPSQALKKLGVSVDATGDVVAFQAEPIAALLAIGLPGGPVQLPKEHHGVLHHWSSEHFVVESASQQPVRGVGGWERTKPDGGGRPQMTCRAHAHFRCAHTSLLTLSGLKPAL